MWRLERYLVDGDEREYPGLEEVEGNRFTIGRAKPTDDFPNFIELRSPNISRKHAELEFRNGAWFITDLGSVNGVFVNDELINCSTPETKWHKLKNDDRIGFGLSLEDYSTDAIAAEPEKYYTFLIKRDPELVTLSSDEDEIEKPNQPDQSTGAEVPIIKVDTAVNAPVQCEIITSELGNELDESDEAMNVDPAPCKEPSPLPAKLPERPVLTESSIKTNQKPQSTPSPAKKVPRAGPASWKRKQEETSSCSPTLKRHKSNEPPESLSSSTNKTKSKDIQKPQFFGENTATTEPTSLEKDNRTDEKRKSGNALANDRVHKEIKRVSTEIITTESGKRKLAPESKPDKVLGKKYEEKAIITPRSNVPAKSSNVESKKNGTVASIHINKNGISTNKVLGTDTPSSNHTAPSDRDATISSASASPRGSHSLSKKQKDTPREPEEGMILDDGTNATDVSNSEIKLRRVVEIVDQKAVWDASVKKMLKDADIWRIENQIGSGKVRISRVPPAASNGKPSYDGDRSLKPKGPVSIKRKPGEEVALVVGEKTTKPITDGDTEPKFSKAIMLKMPLNKIASSRQTGTNLAAIGEARKPIPLTDRVKPSMQSAMHKSHSRVETVNGASKRPTMKHPGVDPGLAPDSPDIGLSQIYSEILEWKTCWLQEHFAHNLEQPPPQITKDLSMSTDNLMAESNQGNYRIYVQVFYPLMRVEFWNMLCMGFKKRPSVRRSSSNSSKEKSVPRCANEYRIGIESVNIEPICPLLDSNERRLEVAKEDKRKISGAHTSNRIWARLLCQAFYTGEIGKEKGDFGIVSLPTKSPNPDDPNEEIIAMKDVFAFVREHSEPQPIVEGTCIHQKLLSEYMEEEKKKPKMRITIQLIVRIKPEEKELISTKDVGHYKQIAYAGPKMREFRAMLSLKHSPLFSRILLPKYDDEVFHADARPPGPAQLVSPLNKCLNPVQKLVVHHAFNKIVRVTEPEIMLLHGPPGTGKTTVIVCLIAQLLKGAGTGKFGPHSKLVVCTPSNSAVDDLLIRVDKFFDKHYPKDKPTMVRIGSHGPESRSPYCLDVLAERLCQRSTAFQTVCNSIEEEKKHIEDLDQKIGAKEELYEDTTALNNLRKEAKHRLVKHENERERIRESGHHKPLKSEKDRAKNKIMQESTVVFTTLNSCSCHFMSKFLGRVPPTGGESTSSIKSFPRIGCCIVDEATQSTEPESLAPLMLDVNKLFLVGDPKQLPATVLSKEAAGKDFTSSLFARHYSLFERKFYGGKSPVMYLDTQYRMHPEILQWPNKFFYSNILKTGPTVKDRERFRFAPFVFIDFSGEESRKEDGGSLSNVGEAALVMDILDIVATHQRISSKPGNCSIGIITPYSEQKKELQISLASSSNIRTETKKDVTIDTVDSFQGQEKDIIIISCVRSESLGFLRTRNRLCVAVTRARQSLIIIGHAGCLQKDPMWEDLIQNAKSRGVYHHLPSNYKTLPKTNGKTARSRIEQIVFQKEEQSMIEEEPTRRPSFVTSRLPRR